MRKGFALLTIVCLAAPAHAETLAGALARTLATNPALEAARSNYKVSYKEQFVTMADMLPQIRGFASRVETDIDLENTRTNTPISTCRMWRPTATAWRSSRRIFERQEHERLSEQARRCPRRAL